MEQLTVKELKDMADARIIKETRAWIKAVCSYFDVTEFDLKRRTRQYRIAYPRQLLIYVLNEHRLQKYSWMSAFFGIDHSTCSQNASKVRGMLARQEPEHTADIANLRRVLSGERLKKQLADGFYFNSRGAKVRQYHSKPERHQPIKRPAPVYSNRSPYGIASSLHGSKV